jgi:hypothetical protein
MSKPTPRTKWDHYFAQWCIHWLPFLGLKAEEKPRFSQLPLEADVLVIRTDSLTGRWKEHAVWQHVSPYTVVEFKSVHDDFKPSHWGKLMAYVGLTMQRQKLGLDTEIAGWLVVPYINSTLQTALTRDSIGLETLYPGFHKGRTSFFPLVIIEYNHLPLEADFLELKSFMKKNPLLPQIMRQALLKWAQKSGFLHAEYSTMITSIHAKEAEKVIEVLEQDMPKIKRMANKLVKMLGDQAHDLAFVRQQKLEGKLEGKLGTARNMLLKGFDHALIAELTGLPLEDIVSLSKAL